MGCMLAEVNSLFEKTNSFLTNCVAIPLVEKTMNVNWFRDFSALMDLMINKILLSLIRDLRLLDMR